jgi:hypothetical protein
MAPALNRKPQLLATHGRLMNPSEKKARFFGVGVRPWSLVEACGAVLSTATVFGFLGRFWWFLDPINALFWWLVER